MPVIYLKHPVHGAKVANLEMEAKYDEQHGWVRYVPTEAIVPSNKAQVNQLTTLKSTDKVPTKNEG